MTSHDFPRPHAQAPRGLFNGKTSGFGGGKKTGGFAQVGDVFCFYLFEQNNVFIVFFSHSIVVLLWFCSGFVLFYTVL